MISQQSETREIATEHNPVYNLYNDYIKHKIITLGAKTKQNSLLKFLQFKDQIKAEK